MSSFGGVSGAHLKQLIEKVERLEEHKTSIADDIKEVYAEAKAHGFDVKVIRTIIRDRKIDPEKLAEHEEMLTLYLNALNQTSAQKSQPKVISDSESEFDD